MNSETRDQVVTPREFVRQTQTVIGKIQDWLEVDFKTYGLQVQRRALLGFILNIQNLSRRHANDIGVSSVAGEQIILPEEGLPYIKSALAVSGSSVEHSDEMLFKTRIPNIFYKQSAEEVVLVGLD